MGRNQHGWSGLAHRYPPLVTVVVALVLAILTLPSALNLPLANPGQTLEYAPVPGNGTNAPPGSNLAGLGLGSSNVGAGGLGGVNGGLPAPPPPTSQSLPSSFQCVGNPPRQTEDPLSPPCVAGFHGDNGGATYTGVTRNEVTVVFYFSLPSNQGNGYSGTSEGFTQNPPQGWYDMDSQSDVSKWLFFRYLHDLSVYYNARYQTYGRHVHFWAYNDGAVNTDTVTAAKADAAANWNDKHPFADQVPDAQWADVPSYTSYMAQHGALTFSSGNAGGGMTSETSYQKYPGLFWGYPPALETQASMYTSYVCSKVKPYGTDISKAFPDGTPRKYGLLYTTDNSWPTVEQFDSVVEQQLRACGVSFIAHSFPHAGINYTSGDEGIATQNMADFQKNGVTTILMVDGSESNDEHAAESLQYYPEWVVAGVNGVDGNFDGTASTPKEWSNAWVVTSTTLQSADGEPVEPACYQALETVDPSINKTALDISYACTFFFDNVREMFTGIQVAGPKLTPQSIDQGFHAIPGHASSDPATPACYYDQNDYTCVKDAVAEWWDPNAHPAYTGGASGATSGCWRMWLNGQRFRIGAWPAGNVTDGKDPNSVCNLYQGGLSSAAAPPGG